MPTCTGCISRTGHLPPTWHRTAARQLGLFSSARGMPHTVECMCRDHREEYRVDLRGGTRSGHTLPALWRQRRAFFSWLVDDGQLEVAPLAHSRPSVVDDVSPSCSR